MHLLLISIQQVMMLLHRVQVLHFALLKVRVALIPTSHSHHHLIVSADHVVFAIVIRVMIWLLILL